MLCFQIGYWFGMKLKATHPAPGNFTWHEKATSDRGKVKSLVLRSECSYVMHQIHPVSCRWFIFTAEIFSVCFTEESGKNEHTSNKCRLNSSEAHQP
jgi:hypothetical protein